MKHLISSSLTNLLTTFLKRYNIHLTSHQYDLANAIIHEIVNVSEIKIASIIKAITENNVNDKDKILETANETSLDKDTTSSPVSLSKRVHSKLNKQ